MTISPRLGAQNRAVFSPALQWHVCQIYWPGKSSTPKPFAFVRAIGPATIQTARDAANAGLVHHSCGSRILLQDAAAIGWDLSGVGIPATGEREAIEGDCPFRCRPCCRLAGVAYRCVHGWHC